MNSRKRCREDDFLCDSMPLSKRINNLHLSGTEMSLLHSYQNMVEPLHQQSPLTADTTTHSHQQNNFENHLPQSYQQPHQHINNNNLPQDYILKSIPQNAVSESLSINARPLTSVQTTRNSTTNEAILEPISVTSICGTNNTNSTSSDLSGNNLMGIGIGLDGAVVQDIYNPELSENENPFYYMKNKLLHELHIERSRRCQMIPNPETPHGFRL